MHSISGVPSVEGDEPGDAERELVAAVHVDGLHHTQAHPQPQSDEVRADEGGSQHGGEAEEEDLERVGVLGSDAKGGGIPVRHNRNNRRERQRL